MAEAVAAARARRGHSERSQPDTTRRVRWRGAEYLFASMFSLNICCVATTRVRNPRGTTLIKEISTDAAKSLAIRLKNAQWLSRDGERAQSVIQYEGTAPRAARRR
jgi:hypothetical protein